MLNAVPFDASASSSLVEIKNCVGYALSFVWSGATSASGSMVISGTNDDPAYVAVPTLIPVYSTNVNTNSGQILVNVERAMYPFVQCQWVRSTGGTGGTLTAKISIKTS